MQRISVDRVFATVCESYEEHASMRPGSLNFTADCSASMTAPPPKSALANSSSSVPRATLILVAGLLLLRLATLAAPDLFPEEAYWLYTRHLDVGYLDHPPMVAWLMHFGTTIFGHGEFGVRIFALLCHLVTCFFVFRLTALCLDRRAAWTAMAMLQVLPFFFMRGFMITPEAPLTPAGLESCTF